MLTDFSESVRRRVDCRSAERVDLPLALALSALILLLPAATAPLMSVVKYGAVRDDWLSSGVYALDGEGFPQLGLVVFICSVLLPFVYVGALIWVLATLRFLRDGSCASPLVGQIYRWVRALRPWMMIEVFVVGGFVAYSRIGAIADVEIDVGGWCLLASTFLLLLALTQVDAPMVWSMIRPGRLRLPPSKRKSRWEPTTLACIVCDLILPAAAEGTQCPRCRTHLSRRKPDSLRRTTALLIAGYLLYIPANLLPVLTIDRLGDRESDTIISGVFELLRNDMWGLAIIVFCASIVVPLTKLLSLTWMLIAIHVRSGSLLRARSRLFRVIDLIGRWSNIDLFMASVLVALLQFGTLTSVRIGAGLVAFAAVVVITMFATIVFDARLMWDAVGKTAP